jgi:hypothetical protein
VAPQEAQLLEARPTETRRPTVDTTSIRPDAREGRALVLYQERGSEFVRISSETFLVPSCSRRGEYLVDLAGETCECEDHKRNGGPCKHAYSAMLYQSWLRRAARRVALVLTDSSPPPDGLEDL